MIKNRVAALLCIGAYLVMPYNTLAQEAVKYQKPPQSIAELIDAPLVPKVLLNDNQTWMLVLKSPRYVDMNLAANSLLGLGGLRVNPVTRTLEAENHGFYTEIEVHDLRNDNKVVGIQGLPEAMKMSDIKWSPSGQSFVFTHRTPTGLSLWLADLQNRSAKEIFAQPLNALIGDLLQWHPSGEFVIALVPSRDDSQVPVRPRIPGGPIVQESLGEANSTRTYQYLLSNPHDEDLFDHYLESQLTKIYLDGRIEKVGKPFVFKSNTFSPDGNFILVERLKRPYSYQVPLQNFPAETEIWAQNGEVVASLASTALTFGPTGTQGDGGRGSNISPDRRNFHWRADKPHDVAFFKSLDSTKRGDGLYTLTAPFTNGQKLIYSADSRLNAVVWGDAAYAVVRQSGGSARSVKSSLINPETGMLILVIDERSSADVYSDPGNFVLKNNTLLFADRRKPVAFTIGTGASPTGERPFLLRWDLLKNVKDTLFKSSSARFEMPVTYDGGKDLFITREMSDVPPNLVKMTLGKKLKEVVLTDFVSPYTGLQGVQKQMISYIRKDGLKLTATLYLPKGFVSNGPERLPVLVWAYPREFRTAELAEQVKGSPNRFTELNFRSPVYWVTRGYAIVENAGMPIVAEGKGEPNDTFVEQLELNAAALIDYLVDTGIADRNRFGVGGHSYGAFMTANLLAHTDLFAAGIARSGAYNRTLTPFGFQSERRSYWKAKDLYDRMSPFTYAHKIKSPILITHGMDDENSGTFPVQSERLYAAIKGHGGITRLVLFPHEFHGFRARESIMHIFWEQDQWLEKYVKNRKIDKI